MITQSSSANQKRHPSTVNIPLNRDYLPIPWYLNAAFLIAGGIVATILINLSFLIVDEVPVWPYAAVGLLIYGALHKLSSQWFHERGLNLIVGHGYLKIPPSVARANEWVIVKKENIKRIWLAKERKGNILSLNIETKIGAGSVVLDTRAFTNVHQAASILTKGLQHRIVTLDYLANTEYGNSWGALLVVATCCVGICVYIVY